MKMIFEVWVRGTKIGTCEKDERVGLIIAAEQAGVIRPLNGDYSEVEFRLIQVQDEVIVS